MARKEDVKKGEKKVCAKKNEKRNETTRNVSGDCIPKLFLIDNLDGNAEQVYRKFLKSFYVAGVGFHDIDEVWEYLFVGRRLAMVRESTNKHDPNAVAIAFAEDYNGKPDDFDFDLILGYVPRSQNKQLAAMMDMGWSDLFVCEISKLNENSDIRDRVEVSIYVKNKELMDERPNLRVFELNFGDFVDMRRELKTKGFACFRWGGYPPEEFCLPEKNEKVVCFFKDKGQSVLYLMHVFAVGRDAFPFIGNEKEFDIIDDCCWYMLTISKGPLKIPNSDLPFGKDLFDNQPGVFLSKSATEILYNYFDKMG